ncbi:aldehyde-activating protein [Bordetella sp. H567]|uniref:GFA family protein n=1 Tax=Bordetella sp. H567 TaxID=1697043 RepID=UPI00081CD7E7|nr:GFA family protein [Bordetella sp. H567]AOB33183.1 aldehyde-activating protein [Bordetella sp. H567]
MPERGQGDRLSGSCLCGQVRYTVEDRFEYAMNCHCSQCRRATGSAFKAFAGIALGRLALVPGTARTMIHGDPTATHDVHCGTCGSLLYSVVRDGAYAHVAMGTLVDTPSIRPSMHIFVGSKAGWYEITDGLPQHEGLPSD